MNRRARNFNWLLELFADCLQVREIPSMLDYCRGLNIPKEVSPTHPGKFREDITPIATSLVCSWADDPVWRELWVVKGSQGGMSQAAQNWLCEIVEYALGDTMMVLESGLKSKDIGNERVKEMFRANLSAHIADEKDQLQNRCLKVNGVRVHLAGARSAGAVASRTLRFGIGDEIDEWLVELMGGESNAADLFRERFKLVDDAKLLFFSKPRNAVAPEEEKDVRLRNRKKQDDGIIWQEFLTGSRHYCFVPCHRCGHEQHLVWEQVRFGHCRNKDQTAWDFAKVLAETHYECIECKAQWDEDQKVEAILKHHKWKPTNDGSDKFPPVPRKMSAHMSDLYVNSREFPTLTLGQLALKCVTAQTTSAKRAFRRGTLGLPVELKVVEKADIAKMKRLCGDFERGTCPADPALVAMQIDVQEHGALLKWTKMAFTMDDVFSVFDFGYTEVGDELPLIMDQPIILLDAQGNPTTETVRCEMAWIDEGDGLTTAKVLDLCLHPKLYGRLATCKGRGGRQTETMADRVVLQENRIHKGRRVDRYLIDEHYFKDQLYEERINQWGEYLRLLAKNDPKAVVPTAPRIRFFKDAPTELLDEYCHERRDWHVRLGKLVHGWPLKPEGGGKNDYADTSKDGLALWYVAKIKILKILARQEALRAVTQEPAKPEKPPGA